MARKKNEKASTTTPATEAKHESAESETTGQDGRCANVCTTPSKPEAECDAGVEDTGLRADLDFIRQNYTLPRVEAAINVGKYLLNKYFGGDPKRYGGKAKSAGFIKLCAHPELEELNLSASTLRNYIRVYITAPDYLPDLHKNLPLSIRIKLLALSSREDRIKLAQQAVEEHLSAREVGRLVKEANGESSGDTDAEPPEKPAVIKVRLPKPEADSVEVTETVKRWLDQIIGYAAGLPDELRQEVLALGTEAFANASTDTTNQTKAA